MTHPHRTLLLPLLLLVATVAMAQQGSHRQWLSLSTEQLLRAAQADMDNGGSKDTALVCYTIVANRYDPSMTKAQKQQCADANMHLWSIYYYDFYDYPKCFECLTRAREIADEMGREIANIYLGLGCMYQTISEETANYELGTKALQYYLQALHAGIRTHDDPHTDMACTNVVSMASTQQGLASIASHWQRYSQLPDTGQTVLLRRYNRLLHDAYDHMEHQRYDDAIAVFDRQLSMIEGSEYVRLIYFTCVEKAKTFAQKGDYATAIQTLQQPEQIATSMEMKDCMLEVFGLLADYNGKANHPDRRQHYRESYMALKDTLTNYHQLASVSQMEFRNELKQMDQQMADMRQHRQLMTVVTTVVVVFLVVLLALLAVVFRQNSRLKKQNRTLYQHNVALLRAEDEQRRMRRQLHEEAATTAKTADSIDEVKYKNSNLSDADKEQLRQRITDVMENSSEIFSPDFSVERLAVLADSKYKYVSQVINEHTGQNFNTFLNQYRIKEACKRMNDVQRYGQFTIEAISSGVGFKSRSTFVSSFKRNTGLTPSEYQRLALEQAGQEA